MASNTSFIAPPTALATPADARAFALAGNAIFTLRSKATGERFTFRVRQPRDDTPHFVALLRGPDNTSDYSYLGTIYRDGRYKHGKRSPIGPDAPSARAFDWFWRRLEAGLLHEKLEIWHEGRCGRCGRLLTVPESVARGIGPDCAGRMGEKQ